MARKLRLGSISLGKIRNDLQESSQLYNTDDIPNGLWNENINEAVSFLSKAMGWKDLPDYRDTIQVPIIKALYSNLLAGSNYNHTSFQLTIPLLAFGGGLGFDSSWIGAVGTMTDTTGSGTIFNITIQAIIDSQNVIVLPVQTVSADINSSHLIANIDTSINNEVDDIDLTQYLLYKQIDKIEKITFTNIANSGSSIGGGSNIFTKKATGGEDMQGRVKITSNVFESIKSSIQQAKIAGTIYSNYADQIIWYRQGEILKMFKGELLTTYGTRLMYVKLKPAVMVLDSDLIDVLDENVPIIKRFARISTLAPLPKEKFNIALPQEDMSWYQNLQALQKGQQENELSTK